MRSLVAIAVSVSCASLLTSWGLNHVVRRAYGPALPRLTPTGLASNSTGGVERRLEEGAYRVRARFRDHRGVDGIWSWGWEARRTDRDIARFGIPSAMLEPFRGTPEVLRARRERLEAGLFRRDGQTVGPDHAAMVEVYAPYVQTLVELSARAGHESVRARLRALLKLLQDVPYGVPPARDGDKLISGLLTPPQVFLEGWGDCDSKALILATAALALDRDVVLLKRPGHLLLGIEGVPRVYERTHTHRGKRYILAEPAGTARRPWGQPSEAYPSFLGVDLLTARPKLDGAVERGPSSVEIDEARSPLRISSARREGAYQVLEVIPRSGLSVRAALRVAGEDRSERVLVDAPEPGRARVRVALGARGTHVLALGARPVGARGAWTADVVERFGPEPGARPARFPRVGAALSGRRWRLNAPLDARLTPGAPLDFDVWVEGASSFELRRDGRPPIPLASEAGRVTTRLVAEDRRLWLYAHLPGVSEAVSVLFLGP